MRNRLNSTLSRLARESECFRLLADDSAAAIPWRGAPQTRQASAFKLISAPQQVQKAAMQVPEPPNFYALLMSTEIQTIRSKKIQARSRTPFIFSALLTAGRRCCLHIFQRICLWNLLTLRNIRETDSHSLNAVLIQLTRLVAAEIHSDRRECRACVSSIASSEKTLRIEVR